MKKFNHFLITEYIENYGNFIINLVFNKNNKLRKIHFLLEIVLINTTKNLQLFNYIICTLGCGRILYEKNNIRLIFKGLKDYISIYNHLIKYPLNIYNHKEFYLCSLIFNLVLKNKHLLPENLQYILAIKYLLSNNFNYYSIILFYKGYLSFIINIIKILFIYYYNIWKYTFIFYIITDIFIFLSIIDKWFFIYMIIIFFILIIHIIIGYFKPQNIINIKKSFYYILILMLLVIMSFSIYNCNLFLTVIFILSIIYFLYFINWLNLTDIIVLITYFIVTYILLYNIFISKNFNLHCIGTIPYYYYQILMRIPTDLRPVIDYNILRVKSDNNLNEMFQRLHPNYLQGERRPENKAITNEDIADINVLLSSLEVNVVPFVRPSSRFE